MSEPAAHDSFDPYYEWLGIPPKDQPPHHYRLLRINLFESDPGVISAAADSRMALVRSLQTDANWPFSQKILNEISAARLCLLSAAKKAQYDRAIRARTVAAGTLPGIKAVACGAAVAAPPADEEVILLAEAVDANVVVLPPLPPGGQRSEFQGKKSTSAILLPLAALGVMLLACLVAVAVVMSRTPETRMSDAAQGADGPSGNAEPGSAKSTMAGDKPQVAVNPAKSVQSGSPLRPSEPAVKPDATLPAKPSETPRGDNTLGAVRSEDRPQHGYDPFAEPAKPAEAEKVKTPEELDRQLAAAKSADDYGAVANAALWAAAKAVDDRQEESAKKLIVKALVAARKADDAKLIVKVTRALTAPQSVKEILAEKDAAEAEAGDKTTADAESHDHAYSDPTAINRTTARGPRPVRAGPAVRKVAVSGSEDRSHPLGAVRRGTQITLQFAGGAWRNAATRASISPDDASRGVYRVVLVTHDSRGAVAHMLPTGTAVRPFHWKADRDYDSLALRCSISGVGDRLSGTVRYWLTIDPPGQ